MGGHTALRQREDSPKSLFHRWTDTPSDKSVLSETVSLSRDGVHFGLKPLSSFHGDTRHLEAWRQVHDRHIKQHFWVLTLCQPVFEKYFGGSQGTRVFHVVGPRWFSYVKILATNLQKY